MNLSRLLKKYEVIYLSFEPDEEESLKNRLREFGFDLPEKLHSPVKIHRDLTVSFISGFCEGMLYSSDYHFKKLRPQYFKTEYSKISNEHAESAWYKCRAQN